MRPVWPDRILILHCSKCLRTTRHLKMEKDGKNYWVCIGDPKAIDPRMREGCGHVMRTTV